MENNLDQSYGDACVITGCDGVIDKERTEDQPGCSCHVNPPCGWCVDAPLFCTECDWTSEDEEFCFASNFDVLITIQFGEMLQKHFDKIDRAVNYAKRARKYWCPNCMIEHLNHNCRTCGGRKVVTFEDGLIYCNDVGVDWNDFKKSAPKTFKIGSQSLW